MYACVHADFVSFIHPFIYIVLPLIGTLTSSFIHDLCDIGYTTCLTTANNLVTKN